MAWTPSTGTKPVVDLVRKYENLDSKIETLLGSRPTETQMESFPYDIYKFIIKALRNLDQDATVGGSQLLYRYLLGHNEIFYLLKENISNLSTLFNPEEIAEEYIENLLHLVGFGSDFGEVHKNSNLIEKRRIAAGATEFWKATLQDLGVETSVRMVTGNRFKYRDYFDFRNISGEQLITEDLENEDIYLLTLDTLGTFENGTKGQTSSTVLNEFTDTSNFIFTQNYIGANLVISGDTGSPSNNGYYEIISVDEVNEKIIVGKNFPSSGVSNLTYSVFFPYNEYLQELRVMDYRREYDGVVGTGSPSRFTSATANFTTDDIGKPLRIHSSSNNQNGNWEIITVNSSTSVELKNAYFSSYETGLLWSYDNNSVNRILLEELLDLQRAGSERINVVYVDLIDMFDTRGDLSQWDDAGLNAYTATVDDRVLTLSTTNTLGGILFNGTYSDDWTDYNYRVKMAMKTNGTARIVIFENAGSYYYLEIDYSGFGTGTLKLYKHEITDTQIGSTYTFSSLNLDTYWTYGLSVFKEGSNKRFNVELDGINVISTTDSPIWDSGTVGLFVEQDTTIEIAELEAFRHPVEINRVGPNP